MFPPYTTTVVGAHSIPRWYEALQRHVDDGPLESSDMDDAQFGATQAAISDQGAAGIDITGGEMLEPEQTQITSPCGMNHIPRHTACAKLKAMSEAKAILGREARGHARA